MTKQELDILLDELKSDVARMRPTPLTMAMATDVFWAVDPLPSSPLDAEDDIERARRLRRPA